MGSVQPLELIVVVAIAILVVGAQLELPLK